MKGGPPQVPFMQTAGCNNKVHLAAYHEASFFANSYPLWMSSVVSTETEMVSLSNESTSSTEQNQLNTDLLATISH